LVGLFQVGAVAVKLLQLCDWRLMAATQIA
jgi:hypothetical protein